ncbi:ATP-binding protein [Paraliobacillus salinarum]|uniref:ATP-binding protein n=1 Tax=Paraliobacillus salinarum TaxID=1158996 RepID=UPI0015F59647|nr:AAA family ATPase [Paraliobacillus salinarum]
MKIQHVEIYGFGKWENKQFDFSDQSFIILSGENEAGKSTLRQFILFILFGMPPRERKVYLPKKGGKLGGRISVKTEEDFAFTIERMHDRNKGEAICYTADGVTHDEDWLNHKLSGINKDTFLSIFSFDATMLSRLHQMKQQDIGEVLLGVGMTGTDQIYLTEKWLEQQLQDYFKPQGKKPKINQLMDALAEKQETLSKLEQDATRYKEKQYEIEKEKRELDQLYERQQALQLELQRNKQMMQQYDVIASFQTIKQELENYPDKLEFPEQGLERLEQLNYLLYPLQSEINMLQVKIEKETTDLKKINKDLLTVEEKKAIEDTLSDTIRWKQYKQDLTSKYKEKKQQEQEINHVINQLQLNLNFEDLQELSLPFGTEENWIQLKEERQELYQAITKTDHELQVKDGRYQDLLVEQTKIGEQLLPPAELDHLKQSIEKEEEVIRQQEQVSGIESQRNTVKDFSHQKKRTANLISIIGVALTAMIGFLALILEEQMWFIIAGSFLLLVIFVRWNMHQSIKSMNRFLMEVPINKHSRVLTDEALSERKQLLRDQETWNEQKEAVTKEMKEIKKNRLQLEETKKFHSQRQQLLKQKINEQIEKFPVLKGIAVEQWPKLYHHLEALLNQMKKYISLSDQITLLKQQLDDLEDDIKQTYHKQASESADISDTIEMIKNNLRQAIDKTNLLVHKKEDKEKNLYQLKNQLEERQAKIVPLQNKIKTLLELANVSDEESFFKKGQQKKDFDLLYKEYKAYQNQLNLLLSKDDWSQIDQGEQVVKSEIIAKYETTNDAFDENEQRIQQVQQNVSDLKISIKQLETSQVLLDEKHRYYQLQNELQQQTKQWAIYQLAKNKIEATKHIYYDHYLPTVLSHTTAYFNQLTSGNYLRVLFDDQKGELLTEDKYGIQFEVHELSQGTRDQLYISLRIGMSMFIKRHHNMPFFVDDAFVHFDATRLRNILTALSELANTSQIIWFTKENIPSYCLDNKNVRIHRI